MPTNILISAGEIQIRAQLNDSETAKAIADVLPIEAEGNWWGDEIYFAIPVHCEAASDARANYAVGEFGYWPPGNAFCIFYGATPASSDGTPMMANPGNPIGQSIDDPELFRQIPQGSSIRITLDEEFS